MKSLDEVLNEKIHGIHYGCRVLLPFKADILKAVVEKNIIMDFSRSHKGAHYSIKDDFTEIYFHDYKSLTEKISEYEAIKLVIVEEGKDIFDFSHHRKIALRLDLDHKLIIEEIGDDLLLIE